MNLDCTSQESVDELLEDTDVVTMGITPSGSGELHLGHCLTIYRLLQTLEKKKVVQSIIYLDDREFGLQVPPEVASSEVTDTLVSSLKRIIDVAGEYLHMDALKERVEIMAMSDFFKLSGMDKEYMGEDLLNLLLSNKEIIGKAFSKMNLSGKSSIKTLCPVCKKGPVHRKKRRRVKNKVENGIVSTVCKYKTCSCNEYEVKVNEGEDFWTIYYALVYLRDVLFSGKKDVSIMHFFGGDYALPWGQGGISKIERMRQILIEIEGGRKRIELVSGPLLTTRGKKLSKRSGDRLDTPDFSVLDEILINNSKGVVDLTNLPILRLGQ